MFHEYYEANIAMDALIEYNVKHDELQKLCQKLTNSWQNLVNSVGEPTCSH